MSLLSSLWRSLARPFSSPEKNRYSVVEGKGVWVFVQCNHCNEKISLRLRRTDELQRADDATSYEYFVQKTILGEQCFHRIHARLEFNGLYQVVSSEISGGKLITEEEYKQDSP